MIEFVDIKNRFYERFNPKNGFYIRSGVIDSDGNDTGVDPFMRCFPALIDIGIMERCVCNARTKFFKSLLVGQETRTRTKISKRYLKCPVHTTLFQTLPHPVLLSQRKKQSYVNNIAEQ